MSDDTRKVAEQNDNDLAYAIVEQMGLGFKIRNCSCGQLPCARLRPIVVALRRREEEVRAEERERCARAICLFCAEPEHYGPPREIEGSKRLWHSDLRNDCNGVVQCQAAAIRRDSRPQEGERLT